LFLQGWLNGCFWRAFATSASGRLPPKPLSWLWYARARIKSQTEAEQPAIHAAFDGFFQTVQTKETDKGTALFSRPKASRAKLFAGNNPIANPTREQEKTLQQLKDQLAREAANTGISPAGIAEITLQKVPDAYSGFARSIERLFGVHIQFVHAQGLAQKLDFNGLYLDRRLLFVDSFVGQTLTKR